MVRWSIVDDAKLAKLFEDNVLDPSDTETKTLQKAQEDYFPEFLYANFAPLYRKNQQLIVWTAARTTLSTSTSA